MYVQNLFNFRNQLKLYKFHSKKNKKKNSTNEIFQTNVTAQKGHDENEKGKKNNVKTFKVISVPRRLVNESNAEHNNRDFIARDTVSDRDEGRVLILSRATPLRLSVIGDVWRTTF